MVLSRKKIKGRRFAVLANDGENENFEFTDRSVEKKTDDMVQCSFENYRR